MDGDSRAISMYRLLHAAEIFIHSLSHSASMDQVLIMYCSRGGIQWGKSQIKVLLFCCLHSYERVKPKLVDKEFHICAKC